MTVGGGCGCGVASFLLQSLAISFLNSLMAESRLDLLDTWLRMPLSTELSRLFRLARLARWLPSVVVCRDHGSDLAMSARVSLRQSLLLRPLFPDAPPPPHSRRMSVSCARLDRRRRWFVGDEFWVSFGGEIDVICAAESRLPVPEQRMLSLEARTLRSFPIVIDLARYRRLSKERSTANARETDASNPSV
jgi:hypothetical protein